MKRTIKDTIKSGRKGARKFLSLLPPNLRMPPAYHRIKKFLREAEYWESEKIKSYQLQRLKEIISYAYTNVPGYRQLYEEANVGPADISTLEDIKNFPYVTKELIRDNLDDFTSKAIPFYKLKYMTTGGSTGIPFGFWNTDKNFFIEYAFIHAGWERTGWQFGNSSAVLRGAYIGSPENLWSYDDYMNELSISSYYLNRDTVQNYLSKLNQLNISYLQAYPSTADILADLILENGLQDKLRFKALFLGSENLYDWQREKFAKAFPNAILYSWYGHAEKAVLAMNCEHGGAYHAWPFYGITELLDNHDSEIKEGGVGEIVGTSFWNYATPFIRYKTMDYAEKGPESCHLCRRHFRILNRIEGRLQAFILTSDGRYISMTAINMHDDIFDNLRQFRFVQDEKGILQFQYVPKRPLNGEILADIHSRLMTKFGSGIELHLKEVFELNRNKSGKYSFLEQKMNIKYGE